MKRLIASTLQVKKATDADLDRFYDDWSLTLEGINESDAQAVMDWVKEYTPMKNEVLYIVKGNQMNEKYSLTGNNRYPDDLTIMVIMLKDMESPDKITMPRFEVGGRWFTDVVDNNARREEEF